MSAPILRYPFNIISERDDYLKINVIQYKAPGLESQGNGFALATSEDALSQNIQKPIATIILPIPESIGDTNAASWGEDSLSALQAGLTDTAMQAISGSGIGQALNAAKGFGEKVVGAVQDGTGQKALQAGFAGAAVNALLGQGGNINSLIARATGGIVNQNVELLFNAVTIRPAFQFQFDLVPRFKREADEIKKIIRILKAESAARKGSTEETGGGFFVKAPNVFQLEYMSGSSPHPFLNRFKPTALVGMSVNYTGSGTYSTYSDATPVHMQLTLSFQELTPIYAEDYNTTKGQIGVGY